MMALASMHDIATVLVPGGSTLMPNKGEDLGTVQTISVRFANGELSYEDAIRLGCSSCASSGGGCQFLVQLDLTGNWRSLAFSGEKITSLGSRLSTSCKRLRHA